MESEGCLVIFAMIAVLLMGFIIGFNVANSGNIQVSDDIFSNTSSNGDVIEITAVSEVKLADGSTGWLIIWKFETNSIIRQNIFKEEYSVGKFLVKKDEDSRRLLKIVFD